MPEDDLITDKDIVNIVLALATAHGVSISLWIRDSGMEAYGSFFVQLLYWAWLGWWPYYISLGVRASRLVLVIAVLGSAVWLLPALPMAFILALSLGART